jgi:hypothetical protein
MLLTFPFEKVIPMNFRTLIMLAVAALIIVVAVKMNTNPVASPTTLPDEVMAEQPSTEASAEDVDSVMTEEEIEVMEEEGIAEEPAEDAASETVTEDGDTAEEMAPAAVQESPAEALETGPAEQISEEPVTTPEAQ